MSLLRYFYTCDEDCFTREYYVNCLSSSPSPLHLACEAGHPTEELLRFLLQVDLSQVKKNDGRNYCKPLAYLCENDCCSERLLTCLLKVDSSEDTVAKGIIACLNHSEGYPSALNKIDILLKANPQAAKYRDTREIHWNLLHFAAESNLPPDLCIDIMQRILAIHPDAVKETDETGYLPVHTTASNCGVEVMEFLLSLYPASATMLCPVYEDDDDDDDVNTYGDNLLHLAVNRPRTTEITIAKARFLYSRYPEMMSQRDLEGNTPFLAALMGCNTTHYSINLKASMIPVIRVMCELGGGPELVRVPTVGADIERSGWLPLHHFIDSFSDVLNSSLFSEATDLFHLMLQWYPEAAGIEAGTGVDHRKTPYQLAVDKNLDTYYLRFLLRAAPDLNPAELHRLNFAERRMAMFLAFRAVSAASRPLMLARLQYENMDLLRHVISFL